MVCQARPVSASRFFIPDGRDYRAVELLEWAAWAEDPNVMRPFLDGGKVVAKTDLPGAEVSTVFLGLNHNHFGIGPPLVFETMIFGGPHDGYQERYTTLAEAEAGHAEALALAST